MKKLLLIIFLIGTTTLLVECTPKKAATIEMSAENKAKIEEIRRNYTQAQMDEGKSIFQSSCGKCHRLFEPAEHNISRWEKVLPDMSNRANLDEGAAGKVRAYIIANTRS